MKPEQLHPASRIRLSRPKNKAASAVRPPALLSAGRCGLTMIELMTALSLFIIIFGALMLALNSATNLWQSGARQHEEPQTQHIMDLIADDLYQAVSDHPHAFTNLSSSHFAFLLQNVDTNFSSHTPITLLAFARSGSARTRDPDLTTGTRLSLDAIYYTYYNNALFRHAVPLHVNYAAPESLCAMVASQRAALETPAIHEELLNQRYDGSFTSSALLAQYIVPTLIAYFPETLDHSETNTLPYALDVALHHFSASDWEKYLPLALDSSLSQQHQRQQLGVLLTRRIALPQTEGGRLP